MLEFVLIFFFAFIPLLLLLVVTNEKTINEGNNFQLILVNADFLEEWGLTQMEIDKMLQVEIN